MSLQRNQPMSKRSYTRQPIIPTDLGKRVLRIRLSRGESQEDFGKHFLVSNITVYKWEKGHIKSMHPLNVLILKRLYDNAEKEGRLMPLEMFKSIYNNEISKYGADYLDHSSSRVLA